MNASRLAVSALAATLAVLGSFGQASALSTSAAVGETAGRWAVANVPNPSTSSTNSVLSGVSCAGANWCMAVGSYRDSADNWIPSIEHWDGSKWSVERAPTTTSDELEAVSCSSPKFCMAVGGNRLSDLTERWDGTSWSVVPGAGGGQLNGVDCSSRYSCAAVGQLGANGLKPALTEEWSGSAWSVTPGPVVGRAAALYSVRCVSAHWCISVGVAGNSALAEQWSGRRWSRVRSPLVPQTYANELHGVSCSSQKTCVAAGLYSLPPSGDTGGLLAEQWDGRHLTLAEVPSAGNAMFNGISCTSARSCTAVGDSGNGQPLSYLTVVDVLADGRWQQVPSPSVAGSGNNLSAVSCVASGRCVAVGFYTTRSYALKPLVETTF